MVFVIGGAASGKRTFVEAAYRYAPGEFSGCLEDATPVVCDAQLLVGTRPLEALVEELAGREVVICDEVGCGIVPLSQQQRQWREDVGALSCALAQRADTVVRVVCGIGTVIKGRL